MTKVPILNFEKINEMEEIINELLEQLKKELNTMKLREKFEEQVDPQNKELLTNFLSHLKEDDYEIIYRKIEKWFEKAQKFVKKVVKEFQKEIETKVIIDEEKENLKKLTEELKKTILFNIEKVNNNSSKTIPMIVQRIEENLSKLLSEIEIEEISIMKNNKGLVTTNKVNDVIEHFSSINERKTFEIIEDYMSFHKKVKDMESEIVVNFKDLDKQNQTNNLHMENFKIFRNNFKLDAKLRENNIFI